MSELDLHRREMELEPAKNRRAPSRLATTVIIVLVVVALADAIAVASGISELQLLDRLVANPDQVTESEINSNDTRQGIVGLFQIASMLGAVVLFLIWIHRASQHAHGMHRELTFSPGWSVGWWFVPIACWWMPYQVATEIWRASDESAPPIWRKGSVPVLFPFWWLAWLATNITGTFAYRLGGRADTVHEVVGASRYGLIGDATGVVAAILAIFVVRAMRHRQAALVHNAGVFD